ncbi:hypothetical protein PMIN03_004898 [Paraphaeosphaeria minitans]
MTEAEEKPPTRVDTARSSQTWLYTRNLRLVQIHKRYNTLFRYNYPRFPDETSPMQRADRLRSSTGTRLQQDVQTCMPISLVLRGAPSYL